MEKVKVLEIGPGNFGIGGRSVITWNWYLNWDLKKLQIDFFSYDMAPQNYKNTIETNGGKFYYMAGFYNLPLLFRPIKKILSTFKLAKANSYDCIHIHCGNSIDALIYYLACKFFCKNIILHAHSTNIDCNSTKPTLTLKLKQMLHKVCHQLVRNQNMTYLACSISAANWMFSPKIFKSGKYSVIKNGIKISDFTFKEEVRKKIRGNLVIENKFVIGHIGRFAYVKNHIFLLDIFNEIYRKNSNSTLLLIGSGALESELKRKVHTLKLDEAVIFYGSTSNTYEMYQAMDCFVLPSHFEGLGIVAIEAQAAGLKTICSDAVPKEAQITDLLEYMSLSDSPKKWAEKILSYSNGYERKNMSNEIKLAGYDIAGSAKQLEELYIECTQKTPNHYA